MRKKLVPDNFLLPEKLETDKFKLRMLSIRDVDKDYEAVMSSIEHLQGTFGRYSGWPSPDLTKEQDLIDLGWHQKEFQIRSSFAFTVMSLDESKCLGCVYFYPSDVPKYDVLVFLWVTIEQFEKGLDSELFETVKNWLEKKWLFKNPAFPGRDQDWKEFE